MRWDLPFFIKHAAFLTVVIFLAIGWTMFLKQQERADVFAGDKYIRLHVLANSDSEKDQEIKLKVKDAVVEYLTPYVKDASSSFEAGQIIKERQEGILNAARDAMDETHYFVDLELGRFDFPLKSYGALVLPADNYQAVRIKIGDARGENWWCVLFPPLCFIDGSDAAANPVLRKDELQEEKNERGIKIRWKVMELIKG
jgi:stage II sporulation protein R